MNTALFQLLMMRLKGGLRQRILQLASLRGFLFFLAFGGVIWLLIAANGASTELGLADYADATRHDLSAEIRVYMPLGMFAMTLLTVALSTGPTFHFSPTEINFLFTGPFRRRDLILYKFSAYVAGVVLSCALIIPFVTTQTGSILIAFVASFLTLIFVQLSSAVIGMSVQVLDDSRFGWLRRPVLGLIALCVAGGAFYAWLVPEVSFFDLMTAFRNSWIGTAILIPYIVFSELFLMRSGGGSQAFWVVLAFVINAALLYAVIALDARTMDRALSENARRSQMWERMRQGGSFWATERTELRSFRRARVLGGLGPIAWRQATNALRNSSKVILVFMGIAAGVGPVTSAFGKSLTDPQAMTFIYIFFGFILPRTLVCDFRGDLSRMENYKTLPIAPWRICAGQLVVQVILSYCIAVMFTLSSFLFDDAFSLSLALSIIAFALPLMVLIYAVENTVHLLFPTKLVPMGQADFEFLGRSLVEFIAKTIAVLMAASVSFGVGLAVWRTGTGSVFTSGLVSWMALAAFGVLVVILMQFAFRRFAVAETVD